MHAPYLHKQGNANVMIGNDSDSCVGEPTGIEGMVPQLFREVSEQTGRISDSFGSKRVWYQSVPELFALRSRHSSSCSTASGR